MILPWNEIGGGIVAVPFDTTNGERILGGTHLSADFIRSLRNHRALVSAGYIKVYPPKADQVGRRYAFHVGHGQFDVIEGRKLNDEPLTKDEAHALVAAGSN